MKSSLIRTGSSGSLPVHSSLLPSSPRVVLHSGAINYSGDENNINSPMNLVHLHVNHRPIRRVLSEPDVKISGSSAKLTRDRSQSFPARIPEEDYVSDADDGEIGSLNLIHSGLYHRSCPPVEFSGDEIGSGRVFGGGGRGDNSFRTGGGGSSNRRDIGDYYEQMLKSDPTNSLLLRNYGKFLHEVKGDRVKAEEYYGRAILANPGDGEVLCLYGKLIWETQQDEDRANSYFKQALHASPHDSMVMGSYAQFMWEVEDEEDEEESIEGSQTAMVEAY